LHHHNYQHTTRSQLIYCYWFLRDFIIFNHHHQNEMRWERSLKECSCRLLLRLEAKAIKTNLSIAQFSWILFLLLGWEWRFKFINHCKWLIDPQVHLPQFRYFSLRFQMTRAWCQTSKMSLLTTHLRYKFWLTKCREIRIIRKRHLPLTAWIIERNKHDRKIMSNYNRVKNEFEP
jgi:hypothetical protein